MTAIMVTCTAHVDTRGPVAAERFHAVATKLMDALTDLDEQDTDVADATVSSDAAQHVITVEMLVFTDDQLVALSKASTVLRAAMDRLGARTDDWPIVSMDNHTEKVLAHA